MRAITIFLICAIMHGVANAATCDAGFYLENGECKYCNPNHEGVYCPGDDTRHPCPTATGTDYEELSGWTLRYFDEGRWASNGNIGAQNIGYCMGNIGLTDSYGNQVLVECPFNGENYWCDNYLWSAAGNGYYLSDYSWTSGSDWYSSVTACTNAPTNAHYTGPGTPDAPDGSITRANDCPWECDAGFGRSASGQCLPLCGAGITKICANSVSVPLFNEKHTSPALAIEYAGQVCYADLVPGTARPAINIDYNGQVYHTVNK